MPFRAPAFVAGTFLWPYVADSFFETFAAFGLACAAREVLVPRERPAVRAMLAAAAAFAFAAARKAVPWTTAPVLVLALALREKRRGARSRNILAFLGLFGSGLAVATVPNPLVCGSEGNHGCGGEVYHLETPLRVGLPIVLACVAGSWHGWNGGTAWGPR